MRHLRCFVEVARHGSITRAAQALNTVQPSLSRTLRELEDEIGGALFERTGRGLVLTSAGEILMRHVGVGLSQISKGIRQAQEPRGAQIVTMGVLPNVARTVAPRAIARFKANFPGTDVRVVFFPTSALIDHLQEGGVDFLFGRLFSPERLKGVSFEHLYSEPLVFVAHPDHPLAGRPEVTLGDIDAGLVLVPPPGTIIRSELDKFTVAHGLAEFSNKIESILFEFVRAYLARADATACIPLGAVRPELGDRRLVRLNIATDEMVSSVGLSFASGREINPAAAALASVIREEAAIYAMP
ncbi:LysR family transcriptional regulator [Nitratireductor mangrovi]|uniref:LysR family transcriptional regulator n=2 Tax=Nitratireductor mangrovi TaxID=2599600 RepID=A0A5B8L6G9_9HYPH|nr:LysR family transcriptional regulator [Nitratireductor mangrovi]